MTSDELLYLFQDLHVANVRDGMDWNLLGAQGSMSPGIRDYGARTPSASPVLLQEMVR